MKKLSFVSAMLLTACVTINIYFPAAAADKVADEIIKGIQSEQEIPSGDEKTIAPQSSLDEAEPVVIIWLQHAMNILISPAHAEANLNVDTPEIRRLRASMQARFGHLKSFYDQGLIGIRQDGLLESRGSIPLKHRNTVKQLLIAENKDRNHLYQAIANANGHPEWIAQIKSTFAHRWASNAQAGWWYQLQNGQWKRK